MLNTNFYSVSQVRRPGTAVPKVASARMSYELDDLMGLQRQLEAKVAATKLGRLEVGKDVVKCADHDETRILAPRPAPDPPPLLSC